MDARAHRLLRPGRRTTRGIAALVVLALLAWLGVAATHLHLPGETAAHAHAGADAHGHGPDDARGERAHPCSLCLSLDRGTGAVAPPAFVVAIAAPSFPVATTPAPVASVAAPAFFRSRAPPAHA